MLETTTGQVVNLTLMHEGNNVREFYSSLPKPVLVGISLGYLTPEEYAVPAAARYAQTQNVHCYCKSKNVCTEQNSLLSEQLIKREK